MYRLLAVSLLGALLLAGDAHAKDPCKRVQSHTDPFGATSRGRIFYIGLGGYLAVGLVEEGERTLLKTLWVRAGDIDNGVAAGTPAQVALADGKVLELRAVADGAPVTNATSTTVFTQWGIDYPLTAEQLATLTDSPVVAIKTEVGGGEGIIEVPDNKQAKLQDVARCLAR